MKTALLTVITLGLIWPGLLAPSFGASKYTMPDMKQVDSTCFPNAAANLIYWFGENGYPHLLPDEKDEKSRQEKLVTRLIIDCRTTFVQGTAFKSMMDGLSNYISSCGYDARLTYRGFGSMQPLDEEWFKENDADNKGFVLCVSYFRKYGENGLMAIPGTGHAITLLQYTDHIAVIHDSAHAKGQSGRKVVRFSPLGSVYLHYEGGKTYKCNLVYLNGMPNLSKDIVVGLDGAVCIEMQPKKAAGAAAAQSKEPADAQAGTHTVGQSWWQALLARMF